MCSTEDLVRLGWSVSPKCLSGLMKKTAHGKPDELASVLLDSDLREYGAAWIADHRKSDQLEANGLIVQLVRLRNIAIPQVDEDLGAGSGQAGPRLFRLSLTDGRTTVSALDVDNHARLSMDTPPGTKLRLLGTIPISVGFLILRKEQFQVLGGHVDNLVQEWTMTKHAKLTEGRVKNTEGGPPPFVPFGSKEANALVQAEGRFLQSFRQNRAQKDVFDSFKLATSSSNATKENEFDAEFLERRQGVIAEVKGTNCGDVNRSIAFSKNRFHAGGSKFASLQAEKSQALDEAMAKLISLGYPVALVSSTLKICRGDYQAALDRLLASSTSGITITGTGAVPDGGSLRGGPTSANRTRGGRRGGNVLRGRGGYDPTEEDDPRFDPAAAAAAAGLPSRPSTGLTRLEDLLPTVSTMPVNKVSIQPGPSSSRTDSVRTHLPIGCPILAQNMSGEYEEAVMLGHLTTPGAGGIAGDKVVLVVYTREHDGRLEEEEELVPMSLMRTLNKERITLDMVPPAPPERARAYNLGSTESRGSVHSPIANNGVDVFHMTNQRGYRGRGRSTFRGSRGRSAVGRRGPRRGFRGMPRG